MNLLCLKNDEIPSKEFKVVKFVVMGSVPKRVLSVHVILEVLDIDIVDFT